MFYCPNPKKERQQQVNGQANSAVASKSNGDNKSSTSHNDTLKSFAFLTMGYKSESDDEAMVAAIAAPVSVKSIVPTRPKTPPPITNGPRQLKRLIRPSETIQSTVSDPSITPKIPSVPTANVQRAEVLQSAKVPGPTNLVVGKETYQSIEYLLKTSAWGIDTMASIHCTGNKKLFSTLRSCDALNISVADGGKVVATQWGTIKVRCRTNKASITTLNLTNVYYSPHLGPNLLSAARLVAEHNCELRVNTSGSRLFFTDGTEIPLSSKGKVTTLLGGAPAILYCAISQHGITTIDELVSVHARMNHAGFDRMIKLIELQKTRGLGKLNMSKENIAKARELITNCLACKLGKSTNTPHSGNAKLNHGTRPGEVLHFDTFELSLTNGIHEYGLIVVEPYTGALRAGRLLSKDKIVDHLINIIKQTEVCTQSKVKFLYTDGGTEFINKTLKNYCNESGTTLLYTPPGTPEWNGIAERAVRTIKEGTRTLLKQSGLPDWSFWYHAMNHFIYVWNRIYVSPNTNVTPYEIYYREQPSINNVSVFGCDAFNWSRKVKRDVGTFASRGEPGIYLGHDSVQRCPIIWLLQSKKEVRSRAVSYRADQFNYARAAKEGESKLREVINQSVPGGIFDWVNEVIKFIDHDTQLVDNVMSREENRTESSINGSSQFEEFKNDNKIDESNVSMKPEYEVEEIKNHREFRDSGLKYEIKWIGYKKTSWEPAENLIGSCDELLNTYNSENGINGNVVSSNVNLNAGAV